ncbi:unnamed protein product [Discula destructiva]
MPKHTNNAASATAFPTTPKATSYKRKRKAGEERFYAVRAGRMPGVYATWAECQANITGFQGAMYKAFPTREEAALFAAGKNPNPGSTPDRFYAVAVGNRPGIYTEWTEAQAAYTGVKAPKYKKFETRQAAEEWMEGFEQSNSSMLHGGLKLEEEDEEDEDEDDEDDEEDDEEIAAPSKKKFKPEIQLHVGNEYGNLEVVYTDGSTLSNGQDGAVSGVGVFFGESDPRFVPGSGASPPNPPPSIHTHTHTLVNREHSALTVPPRNISERLPGDVQTNQRAELTAILRALQTIPPTQGVLIWSDSTYAIKCVTEWFIKWENNGWKTHKGPVLNRDLVEMVLKEIRKREGLGTKTVIKWVKGHEGNHGNVAADGLAVRGANEAKASGEMMSGKRRRK